MRERPVLLFLQKHNTMDVKIEESWKAVLQNEFEKPYFAELIRFVKSE